MLKNNQSVLDILVKLLPNRKNMARDKDNISANLADTLFSIWRTSENKMNKNTYKRPMNISINDIQNMQKEGLIKSIGDNIELTEKGAKVIKIMILGDERSSFEDNNIAIDYNLALSNTQNIKEAKKNNGNWWDQFLKQ